MSERLGHAKVGITLDRYSHVVPSMQEEAAAKLEALKVKVKELETRLKLVEGEQRGQVDLSEFMAKPKLLKPTENDAE